MDWAEVWIYSDDVAGSPMRVYDAEKTLEPEVWARDHGVPKFPDAIYFFADLVPA